MSEWESSEGEHWAANAERYTSMLAGFADVVTSAADVTTGQRVLDAGCGNGDVKGGRSGNRSDGSLRVARGRAHRRGGLVGHRQGLIVS